MAEAQSRGADRHQADDRVLAPPTVRRIGMGAVLEVNSFGCFVNAICLSDFKHGEFCFSLF